MNTNPTAYRKWILIGLFATVGGMILWMVTKEPLSSNITQPNVNNPPTSEPLNQISVDGSVPTRLSSPPSLTDNPPRKFREMPASERRAFLREMQKDELPALFQKFLDAGRVEDDPMKQSSIQGLLQQKLIEKGVPSQFTEQMRQFVSDEKNSILERGSIVSAFASTGTKSGAEFVLWVATSHPEQVLRNSAVGNIAYMNGGADRDMLAPMIDPLWRDSEDPRLIKSVGLAMARSGTPSSIRLLLSSSAAPDGQDEVRRLAAVRALAKTYSKNAVPPLEEALHAAPLGSRMHTMAFMTLDQIPDATAAKAIVGWLQIADGSAADLAKQWASNPKATKHIDAVEAALSPDVPFNSELNREALRTGLKAYRAAREE